MIVLTSESFENNFIAAYTILISCREWILSGETVILSLRFWQTYMVIFAEASYVTYIAFQSLARLFTTADCCWRRGGLGPIPQIFWAHSWNLQKIILATSMIRRMHHVINLPVMTCKTVTYLHDHISRQNESTSQILIMNSQTYVKWVLVVFYPEKSIRWLQAPVAYIDKTLGSPKFWITCDMI